VKIKEMSAANPSLEKEEVPHHPSRFCERAATELKGQISFFGCHDSLNISTVIRGKGT